MLQTRSHDEGVTEFDDPQVPGSDRENQEIHLPKPVHYLGHGCFETCPTTGLD